MLSQGLKKKKKIIKIQCFTEKNKTKKLTNKVMKLTNRRLGYKTNQTALQINNKMKNR